MHRNGCSSRCKLEPPKAEQQDDVDQSQRPERTQNQKIQVISHRETIPKDAKSQMMPTVKMHEVSESVQDMYEIALRSKCPTGR